MGRLKGEVALVTGAAQGIGLAIAQLFAREGASVVLCDINDQLGQQQAQAIGEKAHYLHLDVAIEADWQRVADHIVGTYGGLGVLVNNAGITGFLETDGPHNPETLDMHSWRAVHATNLDGVALGCKYAIAMMKPLRSGSIVNISSRSGVVGIPAAAAYASSKAAVRNHSKSVALYCAEKGYGIRCNSIHPGAIYTPMWDAVLGHGEQRDEAIKGIAAGVPLGVMGNPLDVAYGAVYLASKEAKYVTGSELHIDGGKLGGTLSGRFSTVACVA